MNPKKRSETISVRGAVKLVEDHDFDAQPVLDFESERGIARWNSFVASGNSVLALEAFVLAIEANVYPPVELLRWMSSTLKKWHTENGKTSLDAALGLSAGRGQTPPFKSLLQSERDEMVIIDMYRLIGIGATVEQAATMIEARMEFADWNSTPYDMEDLSAETIAKKYRTSDKLTYARFSDNAKFPLNDSAWVSQWLGNFDSSYMPSNLKSRL